MTPLSYMGMNIELRTFTSAIAASLLAISLTGCSVAQSSDFQNFDSIVLDGNPTPTPTQTIDSAGQAYATDPYAEVDIEDQSGDGRSVAIDEIKVARGNSFLVIYDLNGFVLAQSLVTPQSQPVTLLLDSPILESQELQATLYLDNGDGLFELDLDLPILGEEGELVHESFDYSVNK